MTTAMPFAYGLFAATVLIAAAPARAADCPAPDQLSSAALVPVPGGARMAVPVEVNGVDKMLLLSTSGGRTTLTQAAANSLNLHAFYSTEIRLLDDKGNASNQYINVDTVQVGLMRARTISLMLTPDPQFGVQPPLDGMLAIDLMSHFDVEIDFAGHSLNYYSPKHCDGRIAFWQADGIGAVPVTIYQRAMAQARDAPLSGGAVLLGAMQGSHQGWHPENDGLTDPAYQRGKPSVSGVDLRMKVKLDGKDFTANIDTGLEQSTLNSASARAAFDVTANSPGSAPAGRIIDNGNADPGAASETVVVVGARGAFQHTFHTLSFGDVNVVNPHFLVHPDYTGEKDAGNSFQTGSHISRLDDGLAPDITIGMDVLRKLHLYFAFTEKKLYVSAGG